MPPSGWNTICHRCGCSSCAGAARGGDHSLIRLDQRFRLLTGGGRTALPRQQTLRALIDWSYDLLDETTKALLCRLSVFSGGWTLEAAEQVCTGAAPSAPKSGGTFEEWEVLNLLTALVDKSIVLADDREKLFATGLSRRYDNILETGCWRAGAGSSGESGI